MFKITIRPDQIAFTCQVNSAMEALDAVMAGCKLLGIHVTPNERDQYAARLLSMGGRGLIRCCSFVIGNYDIIAELA